MGTLLSFRNISIWILYIGSNTTHQTGFGVYWGTIKENRYGLKQSLYVFS